MSDLKRQVDSLSKKVQDIKTGQDIEFSESLRRNTLFRYIESGVVDNATSNENTTTSVPSGGGNVNHPRQYDRRIKITIDGQQYYIGLHNL